MKLVKLGPSCISKEGISPNVLWKAFEIFLYVTICTSKKKSSNQNSKGLGFESSVVVSCSMPQKNGSIFKL